MKEDLKDFIKYEYSEETYKQENRIIEKLADYYEKIYETGDASHIKTYNDMDDIQTALINIANERTRQNVALKGTKARLESSDAYAAEKADDKSSGGGKK